jgi:hypothetical protein
MSVTKLLFQSPEGYFTIPAGQTILIGHLDVKDYGQIRVVYGNMSASAGSATFFSSTEDVPQDNMVGVLEGNEGLTVLPGVNLTRVYDLPGTRLVFQVTSNATTGSSTVFLYIWGRS